MIPRIITRHCHVSNIRYGSAPQLIKAASDRLKSQIVCNLLEKTTTIGHQVDVSVLPQHLVKKFEILVQILHLEAPNYFARFGVQESETSTEKRILKTTPERHQQFLYETAILGAISTVILKPELLLTAIEVKNGVEHFYIDLHRFPLWIRKIIKRFFFREDNALFVLKEYDDMMGVRSPPPVPEIVIPEDLEDVTIDSIFDFDPFDVLNELMPMLDENTEISL